MANFNFSSSSYLSSSLNRLSILGPLSLSLAMVAGCSSTLPVPPTHPEYVNAVETGAEQESRHAQYQLALLHLFGQESHNPSYINARINTNNIIKDDAGTPLTKAERINKALELLSKAAEKNHTDAQVLLGVLYGYSEKWKVELDNPVYQSITIPQNLLTAKKWLTKAADKGDMNGVYWHARLGYLGEYEVNTEKSIKQLESGAKKGHTLSQTFLAHIYSDQAWVEADLDKARALLELAAHNGDVSAQNSLAIAYMSGKGVEQNSETGFMWFQKAAANGSAIAQYNVASCFEKGIGTEANITDAIVWYQLAAAKQHIEAIGRLAEIYMHGISVPKDEYVAATWFQTGADLGDPEAQTNLGYLYSQGLGVSKSEPEAIKWYREAALQGYLPAIHNLGIAYLEGFGVKPNSDAALKLLTTSAQSGYPSSQFLLGTLLMEGQDIGSQQYLYGLYWVSKAAKSGFKDAIHFIVANELEEQIMNQPDWPTQVKHFEQPHFHYSPAVSATSTSF